MSIENLPPLSEDICTRVKALAADPAVARALDIAREEAPFALEEQISLCEIPAPTFEEDARAKRLPAACAPTASQTCAAMPSAT